MKKIIFNFLFVAALAFAGSYSLTGCGSKPHDEAHEEGEAHGHETEHNEDSGEMAYACPMHPEEKGKEGDKCSKCKMDLEKIASAEEEHEHD